ncbi:class I SAM-dependent DNA methyltransferase [Litoreibacter albidus]|uniref:Methyltransferase domain-containing protein n=1 Tax=Litoreibacter albidus TaxID=670155 RepID=A0A1H2XZ18_9RHOB|nr:class I SAM-dependent methyltransferase [Litoreibacter albidus]SDW97808.1 Methyltransferase domain-containing protein [Litoreibacter albidus]
MTDPSANRVAALYGTHSAAWDRLRTRNGMECDWIDRFKHAMPTAPSAPHVLDLGCGTGQPLAAHLMDAGCKITGVDAAQAMTARAAARFPQQNWITADMRALPPLGTFDGVLAWHSFFHLPPDAQRQMFSTFARLSHAGTALMFTSGPESGETIGTFEGQPLYHASLAPTEYRELLRAHGFRLLAHVAKDQSCGGATVWLAVMGAS